MGSLYFSWLPNKNSHKTRMVCRQGKWGCHWNHLVTTTSSRATAHSSFLIHIIAVTTSAKVSPRGRGGGGISKSLSIALKKRVSQKKVQFAYLPSFLFDFYGFHVGKYTIHCKYLGIYIYNYCTNLWFKRDLSDLFHDGFPPWIRRPSNLPRHRPNGHNLWSPHHEAAVALKRGPNQYMLRCRDLKQWWCWLGLFWICVKTATNMVCLQPSV